MKSIIYIGEDGSGLGWNKVCKEEVVSKLYEDVGEDGGILADLDHGGLVFILEESSIEDWEDLVKESSDLEYVSYEEVLLKVKECIVEEMNES